MSTAEGPYVAHPALAGGQDGQILVFDERLNAWRWQNPMTGGKEREQGEEAQEP